MGNDPSAEAAAATARRIKRIEKYIDETNDSIQNMKMLVTNFDNEENRLERELVKIPRTKQEEILAKVKLIACVQIRKKITNNTMIQLQAMLQHYENLKLQTEMVSAMRRSNQILTELNEDSEVKTVGKLISTFEKNMNILAVDQGRLSDTLTKSFEGFEVNTENLTQEIMKKHNIELQLENQQVYSALPTVRQPVTAPSLLLDTTPSVGATTTTTTPAVMTTTASQPVMPQYEQDNRRRLEDLKVFQRGGSGPTNTQ